MQVSVIGPRGPAGAVGPTRSADDEAVGVVCPFARVAVVQVAARASVAPTATIATSEAMVANVSLEYLPGRFM
jgi:hypothetical protein